jgi:hypothetical protein
LLYHLWLGFNPTKVGRFSNRDQIVELLVLGAGNFRNIVILNAPVAAHGGPRLAERAGILHSKNRLYALAVSNAISVEQLIVFDRIHFAA